MGYMNLKEAFKNCLSGEYRFSECRYIIEFAHTIALAYLRIKVSSGHLYLHNGEPLEDLAWDFIAELFERDCNDSFVILNNIFSIAELDNIPVEEVEHQFRRVILTKVDDNIFRSNGEKDPSLKKIIRNLKNAAQSSDLEKKVVIENGYIELKGGVKGQNSDLITPSEILEIQLSHRIGNTMQMPELLLEVVTILEEFQIYQKKVSLVAVAICIRKAFVHIQHEGERSDGWVQPAMLLHYKTVEKRIEQAAGHVERTVGLRYINKNVLSQKDLAHFMSAAKEIIRLEFTEKHADFSHYDCIKKFMPDLEYDEYRGQYRPVLEYLVKKIRSELVEFYEKEWK